MRDEFLVAAAVLPQERRHVLTAGEGGQFRADGEYLVDRVVPEHVVHPAHLEAPVGTQMPDGGFLIVARHGHLPEHVRLVGEEARLQRAFLENGVHVGLVGRFVVQDEERRVIVPVARVEHLLAASTRAEALPRLDEVVAALGKAEAELLGLVSVVVS